MNDLAAIVSDLCLFYQRRIPSDQTISQWFLKVDGLNLRASRRKIFEIITNGESFPRNVPAAIRSAYSSWVREQPRERQEGGCRHCLRGLLHAIKDHNVYVFRCGHCLTSDTPYPAITRYHLAQHGYALDWQHDFDVPMDRETREKIR